MPPKATTHCRACTGRVNWRRPSLRSSWAVGLRYAALAEPRTAVGICRAIAEAAAAAGALSFEQAAWLRDAAPSRHDGDACAALDSAAAGAATAAKLPAGGPLHRRDWCIAVRVFDAARRPDEARQARRDGCDWPERAALPNVPEQHRERFIEGNRFNRELLVSAPWRGSRAQSRNESRCSHARSIPSESH